MMSDLIMQLGCVSLMIIAVSFPLAALSSRVYPHVSLWGGIAGMYLAEYLWVIE